MGHARKRRPSSLSSVLRSFYAYFGGRRFFCECFLLCSPKILQLLPGTRTRCHTDTHRVSLSASSVCCCEIRRRELAWAFRPICRRIHAWPTLGESTSRVCCLSGVTTNHSRYIFSGDTFTEQYLSICIYVFSVCCCEIPGTPQ